MPDNCVAEGVPAKIVRENITDDDRRELMGLVPREWVRYAGGALGVPPRRSGFSQSWEASFVDATRG